MLTNSLIFLLLIPVCYSQDLSGSIPLDTTNNLIPFGLSAGEWNQVQKIWRKKTALYNLVCLTILL
jgi:hypothetical protein